MATQMAHRRVAGGGRPAATTRAQPLALPRAFTRSPIVHNYVLSSDRMESEGWGGRRAARRMMVRSQEGAEGGETAGEATPDGLGSLKETADLDELIDKLLVISNHQELARAVAENILAFDTKFWIRIATRNDTAEGEEEKQRLQDMANTVMLLVDTMLKKSEQQLSDSGKVLQEVMSAAADAKGEWYLPLTDEQIEAMRTSMLENEKHLDEALLSNAFAWIKKCNEDGFDTMSQLIQKVLQLYAAIQLKGEETDGMAGVVNEVLYADEKDWGRILMKHAEAGELAEPAFMEELQRRMEVVVLGLQSGSYTQRVQAEYLKEVEARAKAVFKHLAEAA